MKMALEQILKSVNQGAQPSLEQAAGGNESRPEMSLVAYEWDGERPAMAKLEKDTWERASQNVYSSCCEQGDDRQGDQRLEHRR